MQWEIKPFKGLGELFFGMSSGQVDHLSAFIGSVERIIIDEFGNTNQYRNQGMLTLSFREDKLIFIGIGRKINYASFKNIFVFEKSSLDVIKLFEKENLSAAKAGFDLIVFDSLGMYLSGFYFQDTNSLFDFKSDAQDDRSITI